MTIGSYRLVTGNACQTIEKVGAIILRDKKVLVVRKANGHRHEIYYGWRKGGQRRNPD